MKTFSLENSRETVMRINSKEDTGRGEDIVGQPSLYTHTVIRGEYFLSNRSKLQAVHQNILFVVFLFTSCILNVEL